RMPLSPPNATATTEIHTLSLHDALPIFHAGGVEHAGGVLGHLGGRVGAGRDRGLADPAVVEADHPEASRQTRDERLPAPAGVPEDRKSTRLNSSHVKISYAVFCLKKKTK